ncbi:4Fe-4S binding protein [Cellulosilyticum ruminicola]|uniref:4Fe-4S binding protein n=1 Tax=Cellulosilyticum ruminicola TaxID=425254 RepID=UPI0006D0F9D4|nr:4Fe-4S binding protein [Cellulosilyticum ruminicola]
MAKRYAEVNKNRCVACGECMYVCLKGAIKIIHGRYALSNSDKCIGCGLCEKSCPAGCITMMHREQVSE